MTDDFNPYQFCLPEALKLLQEEFIKKFQCPECLSTACEPHYKWDKKPPGGSPTLDHSIDNGYKTIDFNSCKCLRLKNYREWSLKDSLLFKMNNELYWFAEYKQWSAFKFKVLIYSDVMNSQSLINLSAALEYDHLPSFVFQPIDEMIRNVEIRITFK